MFFIVFFAYGQFAYLIFGTTVSFHGKSFKIIQTNQNSTCWKQIEQYSTITNTIFSQFRQILGDFDFPSLQVVIKWSFSLDFFNHFYIKFAGSRQNSWAYLVHLFYFLHIFRFNGKFLFLFYCQPTLTASFLDKSFISNLHILPTKRFSNFRTALHFCNDDIMSNNIGAVQCNLRHDLV